MRLVSALAITLLIAGCGDPGRAVSVGHARPPADAAQQAAPSLPADVAAFKQKRDSCDHFRGEEAYDAERGRFLAQQLAATCKGTDRALAGLRTKYAGDPAVTAALAEYETQVE